MKVIKGDLIELALDGVFDVILHGFNCQCVMGAGIAKVIKKQFPDAYDADINTHKGDKSKLGSISFATVNVEKGELIIVNGYTQFHWLGSGVLVDYEAIRSVMKNVKSKFSGKRIGYPRIGAGLAKGDWEIIAQELKGENHTLVEFSQ